MPGTRTGRPISFGQRLSCVLLVASLWQAPIPWIHAHAAHAGSNAADLRLERHLAHFHARDCVLSLWEFAWHVHFALPGELLGNECDEECPTPERAPTAPAPYEASSAQAAFQVQGLLHGDSNLARAFESVVERGALRVNGDAARRPIGYLGSFRESVSISVLICVARC